MQYSSRSIMRADAADLALHARQATQQLGAILGVAVARRRGVRLVARPVGGAAGTCRAHTGAGCILVAGDDPQPSGHRPRNQRRRREAATGSRRLDSVSMEGADWLRTQLTSFACAGCGRALRARQDPPPGRARRPLLRRPRLRALRQPGGRHRDRRDGRQCTRVDHWAISDLSLGHRRDRRAPRRGALPAC